MQSINERISLLLKELNLTKTAFAENLKVSQQYISKLIKTGNPSDLLIDNICKKYSVNEEWLRTGHGEMHIILNQDDQLMIWAGRLLMDESDSFKRRFVTMMSTLTESDWEYLEKKAYMLVENRDKPREH